MGASLPERAVALEFGWPRDWLPWMNGLIDSAGPLHLVELDTYYIDRHAVTNQRYEVFLPAREIKARLAERPAL